MMPPLAPLAAFVLFAAAGPPPSVPRTTPIEAPFPEDYVMLLEAARSGAPPAPTLARESLAQWTSDRLTQALAGLSHDRARATAQPDSPARADDRLLAFAAVLHADLAFGQLGTPLERAATAQLEMARGLLGLLPEAAAPAGLKARWFLGVGCRFRRDFELDRARNWLRAGLVAQPE